MIDDTDRMCHRPPAQPQVDDLAGHEVGGGDGARGGAPPCVGPEGCVPDVQLAEEGQRIAVVVGDLEEPVRPRYQPSLSTTSQRFAPGRISPVTS